jgi:hypothetical protein
MSAVQVAQSLTEAELVSTQAALAFAQTAQSSTQTVISSMQDALLSSQISQSSAEAAQSSMQAALVSTQTQLSVVGETVCNQPVCAAGTQAENGTCVPDCPDLRRRGIACEPFCDSATDVVTPSDGNNNGSSSSSSSSSIPTWLVVVIVIGVAVVVVILGVAVQRARHFRHQAKHEAPPPAQHTMTMFMNPKKNFIQGLHHRASVRRSTTISKNPTPKTFSWTLSCTCNRRMLTRASTPCFRRPPIAVRRPPTRPRIRCF